MTFCKAVSYTQPKISVTYLIFTAECHVVACYDSIYNIALDLFLLLVHKAIKDLDLDLDLDLAVAGLDTRLLADKVGHPDHLLTTPI